MKPTPLTELEAAVLGELSILQPCTAYVIRRSFAQSPTPTWSASAGTIYPALQRLEKRGFVRSRASRTGQRRSRMLSLTPSGNARIRSWLLEPLDHWTTGPPMDPLRVRIGFLGALPKASRVSFLERSVARLRREIRERTGDPPIGERGNPWEVRVREGTLETQRARLKWVEGVLRFAKKG